MASIAPAIKETESIVRLQLVETSYLIGQLEGYDNVVERNKLASGGSGRDSYGGGGGGGGAFKSAQVLTKGHKTAAKCQLLQQKGMHLFKNT